MGGGGQKVYGLILVGVLNMAVFMLWSPLC